MFRTLPTDIGGPEGEALRGAALASFGRLVQAIHQANPELSTDEAASKAILAPWRTAPWMSASGVEPCGPDSTQKRLPLKSVARSANWCSDRETLLRAGLLTTQWPGCEPIPIRGL